MIVSTSNRRRRFLWSVFVSNRESDYFIQSCHLWSFHIRLVISFLICIRFVAFVSSNDLCRLQNDQVFCQMISKRSSSLRSNFLNFISRLKFLFRTQFVHAKTTLNCDRKYYKKRDDDRWWWSANDVTRFVLFSKRQCFHTFRSHNSIFMSSSSFYVLFIVIIISCLSRWNYCATCSWAVYCEEIHTFLRMLCFLLSIVLHQCFFRRIDVVIVACLSFVEMSKLQQLARRKKIFWYFNDQFENV
jgi:hypothetical protein